MAVRGTGKRANGWQRYNVRLEANGTIRVTPANSSRQFGWQLSTFTCHPAEAPMFANIAVDWVCRHWVV